MTIDLVIAYYREDLNWLNELNHINFRKIYIYNKGNNLILNINRNFIEIKLNNIGKCDHTYLYHIIENYNDLGDVIIFTTGGLHNNRYEMFHRILYYTLNTYNSVFYDHGWSQNVKNDLYNFTINNYFSSDPNNKEELDILVPSKIRPFGLWYEKHFPDIIINRVNYGGIFSVSCNHIHHRSLENYKILINEFLNYNNLEVSHYFERAWIAIFHPIPNDCIYPYNNKQKQILLFNPKLYELYKPYWKNIYYQIN